MIDATNVQPEARKPIVALARAYHCLPVAIVSDFSEKLCQERNRNRADRDFGPHVERPKRLALDKALVVEEGSSQSKSVLDRGRIPGGASRATICKETGLSKGTAQRAFHSLPKNGLHQVFATAAD